MSKLAEIKQHLDRLRKLLVGLGDPVTSTALVVSAVVESKNPFVVMRERFREMLDTLAPGTQERFKKEGGKMAAGAGLGVVGLALMGVAAFYLMIVVTLLVDLALDRMWLSALIVVGGTLVFGCIVAVIGAAIGRSGARRLQEATDSASQNATALSNKAKDEIREEVEVLQVLVKEEVEERKRQAIEFLDLAKRFAPAAMVLLLLFGLVRHRRRKRKKLLAETPVLIKEVIYAEE